MRTDSTLQLLQGKSTESNRSEPIPDNPLLRRRYVQWQREIDSLHDLIALGVVRELLPIPTINQLRASLNILRSVASISERQEKDEWEKSQHKGGDNE